MDWSEKQFPPSWQLGRPSTFSPWILSGPGPCMKWDRAGSGNKELAEINLPTSEVWLQAKETSWPQDSEQGGRCPTALPWGAQPKGTFMFQMPNSVSVNTMCFLFHAGVELLLFSTFCTGPKCKQSAEGSGLCRVLISQCHKDTVWGQGPTFQVGRISLQPGQAPRKPHVGAKEWPRLGCNLLHILGQ